MDKEKPYVADQPKTDSRPQRRSPGQTFKQLPHRPIVPVDLNPGRAIKQAILASEKTVAGHRLIPSEQAAAGGCPFGYYVGVGILVARGQGYQEVVEVYPGYGADNAGIQRGDHIRPYAPLRSGEPGSTVRVSIRRDGMVGETSGVFSKDLVREKVCYVDGEQRRVEMFSTPEDVYDGP